MTCMKSTEAYSGRQISRVVWYLSHENQRISSDEERGTLLTYRRSCEPGNRLTDPSDIKSTHQTLQLELLPVLQDNRMDIQARHRHKMQAAEDTSGGRGPHQAMIGWRNNIVGIILRSDSIGVGQLQRRRSELHRRGVDRGQETTLRISFGQTFFQANGGVELPSLPRFASSLPP